MNFLDYLKKNFIYLLICIVIVCFSGFLLLFLPTKNPTQVESQEITLFGISLNNLGIWITIIGALFASIWAMYQYTKNTSIRQQEKASEIARIFSNGLLAKCTIVISVFQNTPIIKLIDQLKNFPSFEIREFTTDEIREITGDDDFPTEYKKVKKSVDFDYIYYRVLEQRITNTSEYKEKYEKSKNDNSSSNKYSTKEARDLFVLDNLSLPFHFSALVDDVLNTLEYVCISLSTHAAGSTYIYQSLHQVFLDIVETLYFEISLRNHSKYSDKFYTNVIHVYKEWKNRYEKSIKKEMKQKSNNNRILTPKIKIVE